VQESKTQRWGVGVNSWDWASLRIVNLWQRTAEPVAMENMYSRRMRIMHTPKQNKFFNTQRPNGAIYTHTALGCSLLLVMTMRFVVSVFFLRQARARGGEGLFLFAFGVGVGTGNTNCACRGRGPFELQFQHAEYAGQCTYTADWGWVKWAIYFAYLAR
jgi:hypothetical protein